MVNFDRVTLDNGLVLIHHFDASTQMVAMNILYRVGSKNESPTHTGLAHLFEHLMFGGSVNIPDYDTPLQCAGGENNAWTNADITNYYLTLPRQNIETGFWLESDRMLELAFSKKSLEVQRKVVIEEFRQRNLNQPYGDVSHLILDMAYKTHPYRWPTIGLCEDHILNTTIEQVKEFFFSHYAPNNAILVISGNISFEETLRLTQKWFAPIPARNIANETIQPEVEQVEARELHVNRNVSQNFLSIAYPMCGRNDPEYYASDLLSDILSSGNSSRLYRHLLMEKEVFSSVNAYISGDYNPGLFRFSAKLHAGTSFETARELLLNEINDIIENGVTSFELEKVKNKAEANLVFSDLNYLDVATNLAYFEYIGDAGRLNREAEKYLAVTEKDIRRVAQTIFDPSHASTLYYHAI